MGDETRNPGKLWLGVVLAGGINLAALVIGMATIPIFIGAVIIALFGALQFCWIVPMCVRYRRNGETETVKGIWIAAGISLLLSVGCWGTIMTQGFGR